MGLRQIPFAIIVLLFVHTLTFIQRAPAGEHPEGKVPRILVGPNVRIYPSNVTQTETFIVRHPSNRDILFASANTINLSTGFVSEGVYLTTNRGVSWFGSDTCTGAPLAFHRGDPGIAIDKNGTLVLVRLGFFPGVFAHYSTNLGATWSGQRTIVTNDQDRATLTSDVSLSSLQYGRSYAAWVKLAPPFPVFFSYTDDGGQNWSVPAQINNPTQRGQGAELAMGLNGTVAVCWAGVINTSPFTEDFVGFGFSTNGGSTWTVAENAYDINGISGLLPQKGNIRVNGLPKMDIDKTDGPRSGWIYVVTSQRSLSPAGNDPDIILNRSTNGGATWSAGIRVNGGPLNNGKSQYFPAIHVDDGGGVNVIYYDDRSTAPDSAGVYLSRSTNGGTDWSDYNISDHNFQPQGIGGLGQGYQGDNIGLTSVGDTLWPVWMDNSTGIYQIWTCAIDISQLGTGVPETALPKMFSLSQNYPNPFNPATTIEYSLQRDEHVLLSVFDGSGRKIAVLVNTRQVAGVYRIQFDAGKHSLATGVYTCRLQVGTQGAVRQMTLVK